MARRRRKSRTTRRTGSHRRPPRPTTWDSPRGSCRFCGEDIIEQGKVNRRKNWHQPCADLWRQINDPSITRRAVFLREKGKCQSCGFRSPLITDFQADHIRPLFEAKGDLSYWKLPNLQLLCIECHKQKTREDMARFREFG